METKRYRCCLVRKVKEPHTAKSPDVVRLSKPKDTFGNGTEIAPEKLPGGLNRESNKQATFLPSNSTLTLVSFSVTSSAHVFQGIVITSCQSFAWPRPACYQLACVATRASVPFWTDPSARLDECRALDRRAHETEAAISK